MEFAIVLPLMLLLVFGVIDFGRALQQQTLLSAAVREGARTAALNGSPATIQARVRGMAGTNATVTSTLCTSSSTTTADATVTASQPFTAVTPIFVFMAMFGSSSSITTLRATGVMSCTG
ncbi:MAG: TadE family protein [Actinomycetota bacterium]|nr:TadE family protein [Actinomycetota bacterium]